MSLDPRLTALFDDLEQQAAGLELTERDRGVAEQQRAEYATVDLVGRLHGSVGTDLALVVAPVGLLYGRLRRVGSGWLLLEAGRLDWLVRTASVSSVRDLSDRAVPTEARSVTARLGLGSALRQLAASGRVTVVELVDRRSLHGRLRRVGADFVEVLVTGDPPALEVVPFSALAAVRVAT